MFEPSRIETISKIIDVEIKKINDHLPTSYKSLKELLKEETPSVKTKGGDDIIFLKDELTMLAKFIPEEKHEDVKLPVIALRRIDLGIGVYELIGNEDAIKFFKKMLDIDSNSKYLYCPQIFELKRKFSSLVIIGFSTSPNYEDLEKNIWSR
ncbi:MAG: DUF61 family protein [Candidatus Methanomethylicia archaeon]